MKIKNLMTVFAFLILVLFTFAGCASKDKLNGIWINEEEGLFIAFIDDSIAFIGEYDGFDYDIETISEYTFEKRTGVFNFYFAEFEMSLKDNVLTLLMMDDPVEFEKLKEIPAHKAIAGVWRGPEPWLFGFVNEKVFIIDRDGDFDYAGYFLDKNIENLWAGHFETEYYGWEIEFIIRDNLMTTDNDIKAEFARNK